MFSLKKENEGTGVQSLNFYIKFVKEISRKFFFCRIFEIFQIFPVSCKINDTHFRKTFPEKIYSS
jgi:hypothetical protein